jgi:hypothetical protein
MVSRRVALRLLLLAPLLACNAPKARDAVAQEAAAPRAVADYTLYEHGKECFERLGVAVPSFSCDGPRASRLKIEVDGVEVIDHIPDRCDKPDLVAEPRNHYLRDGKDRWDCVPGGRITKFTERNAAGDTVVTVVACRAQYLHPLDSGIYENIAILQSNLRTNETCWFQIRADPGIVARNVVSPFSPGRKRTDAAAARAEALYVPPVTLASVEDGSECFRCHDNGVWLRTPWIMEANQVKASPDIDNDIPRTQGLPVHVGQPFERWNLPRYQPAQIQIDAALFDAAHPPTPREAQQLKDGKLAPSDTCTSCHPIGQSSVANEYEGTCNHLARFWMENKGPSYEGTALGMRLSRHGASFPLNAWMPPGAAEEFASGEEYFAYYRRAFKALETCCQTPHAPECGGQLR